MTIVMRVPNEIAIEIRRIQKELSKLSNRKITSADAIKYLIDAEKKRDTQHYGSFWDSMTI